MPIRRNMLPPGFELVDWIGIHSDRIQQELPDKYLQLMSDYGYPEYMKRVNFLNNRKDLVMKLYALPQALEYFKKRYPEGIESDYDMDTVFELAKKLYSDLFVYKVRQPLLADAFFNHQKFRVYGSNDVSKWVIGKRDSKSKLTYYNWPNKDLLVQRKEDFVPHVYYWGPQGSGKTNALKLLITRALQRNYWVYTTLPVDKSKGNIYRNLFQVSKLSDLFINKPGLPSIAAGLKWAQDVGLYDWTAVLALDERGQDMTKDEGSSTVAARWLRQFDQLTRHFHVAIIEGGKQEKSPMLEGMVNIKIKCIRVGLNEEDAEGRQKAKRSWRVSYREGVIADNEAHEDVEDIPRAGLLTGEVNPIDLSTFFEVDFSLTEMLQVVDVNRPLEQVVADTSNFVARKRARSKFETEATEDWEGDYGVTYGET